MTGKNGLPQGWEWKKLESISEIILGQSPPSSTYNEDGDGLPFYQGKTEFGDIYPTPRKWCNAPKKIAQEGDVLISVRAPVGPTNICPETSCIGRGLAAIRPTDGISTKFILYLLRRFETDLAGKGTGTTFQAISGNQLKSFEVPVPPLSEQERIVTKLEETFTQLEAGVAELRNAKAQLKRYRAAVLKSAVEGELTREWREGARRAVPRQETAETLLARILSARQEKWEAEGGKGKYKEPAAPNIDDLPELPDGWTWTNTGQLCDCIVPNRDKPKSFSGDIPWITLPDFDNTSIRINSSKSGMGLTVEETRKYRAKIIPKGSVVMSCVGRFGITSVVEQDLVVNQQLHAFLVPEKMLEAKFLAYAIPYCFKIISRMG